MDEALVMAALDISGRGALYWDVQLPFGMVGDFDAQLAREFFIALAANAGITLHVRQLAGDNAHPRDRGHLQGGGPGAAPGGRARPAGRRGAALH